MRRAWRATPPWRFVDIRIGRRAVGLAGPSEQFVMTLATGPRISARRPERSVLFSLLRQFMGQFGVRLPQIK
jgi:hypothetical protein